MIWPVRLRVGTSAPTACEVGPTAGNQEAVTQLRRDAIVGVSRRTLHTYGEIAAAIALREAAS